MPGLKLFHTARCRVSSRRTRRRCWASGSWRVSTARDRSTAAGSTRQGWTRTDRRPSSSTSAGSMPAPSTRGCSISAGWWTTGPSSSTWSATGSSAAICSGLRPWRPPVAARGWSARLVGRRSPGRQPTSRAGLRRSRRARSMRRCSVSGDGVNRVERKMYRAYRRLRNFACTCPPQRGKLRAHLKADPKDADLVPGFTRDVSGLVHHGTGNLEVQLCTPLLRVDRPLEGCARLGPGGAAGTSCFTRQTELAPPLECDTLVAAA